MEEGRPFDYVIGSVEFLGCKIDLSLKPLIPRAETEFWAEKAIEKIRSNVKGQMSKVRCLDIFAGSGCIGIAMLKACPELVERVDFAEKEKKFLEQIKGNLACNKISSNRYRLVQSDIFSHVKGRYDVIVANPPYLATTRKRYIQKSVLDWEPHAALFAGKDGLLYIRKFLQSAKKYLKPGGTIYMEFDSWQKGAIAKLLKKFSWKHFEFFKDQYGKWRYVVVYEKWPSEKKSNL
jgi:release factor glutamine methyltransferase